MQDDQRHARIFGVLFIITLTLRSGVFARWVGVVALLGAISR
jgi:hypothetical protein